MTASALERRQARSDLYAVERERLKRGGPLALGRAFLPHLLSDRPSTLHHDLNAWHVAELDRAPGAQDAYAAPRGHGKSTAGVEVPALWHAANMVRRFVVIVSDTATQAEERLATIITEAENNDDLRELFPEFRPAIDDRGQVVRWRDNDVVFANGCRILAAGAGKAIRGLRRGQTRPDLLLLDDLEDEDSVATEVQLDKRLRWILRVALGLAGPNTGMSALWVGTILARAALLNLATGAALEEGQARPEWARSWRAHVFRAELAETDPVETQVVDADPDTGEPVDVLDNEGEPLTYDVREPLWAGVVSRETLALIRYKLGPLAYAAEYLSDPVDEATTLLAPPRVADYVNPGAPPMGRVIRLPRGRIVTVAQMTRAAALDPQYAEKTSSNDPDLAAVVVAGQYAGETFLLDCWIGRERHGQAARLIDLAVKWSCYAAGVEDVAAQAVTADAAAADGRIPIIPIKRPADEGGKVRRALGLAVRLGDKAKPETCRVYVLPDALPVVEYLGRFPHGRYKDPVDATVDAVDLAVRGTGGTDVGGQTPTLGGAR